MWKFPFSLTSELSYVNLILPCMCEGTFLFATPISSLRSSQKNNILVGVSFRGCFSKKAITHFLK